MARHIGAIAYTPLSSIPFHCAYWQSPYPCCVVRKQEITAARKCAAARNDKNAEEIGYLSVMKTPLKPPFARMASNRKKKMRRQEWNDKKSTLARSRRKAFGNRAQRGEQSVRQEANMLRPNRTLLRQPAPKSFLVLLMLPESEDVGVTLQAG